MGREKRDTVANDQGFLDRMGDEEECEADILPKRQKLFLHLAAGQGIESGKWLVHKKNTRFHRQGAGYGDALLHAARQRIRVAVGKAAQAHLLQIMFCPLVGLFPPQSARDAEGEGDILPHGLPRR